MMIDFMQTPLFSIAISFITFYLSSLIYQRFKFFLFNPVLISVTVLILFLKLTGISYETYNKGGVFISFLLGPSVVALAVPLYLKFDDIKKRKFSISVSILSGSVVGIISASLTTAVLGGDRVLNISIAPKSVTTPIAMSIAEKIGGVPSLTAAFVIVTGIAGAVLGPLFLKAVGVKDKTAFGLAMGTASHGLGTARAMEEGELEAGAGSLGICLNGVVTALITPALIKILISFGLI